ncbi:hypothetical protein [Crossiella sp. NPDC003009]
MPQLGPGGAATFTGSVPRTTVAAPVVWAHHFGGRAGHKSVWLDVSFNRGASWIQCGPFETWGDSVDSRIHVTSPDPASVCSRWR